MRFRTEIENCRASFGISHEDGIVMLGSCFSDNVGARLARDGFNVTVNPLGPLYNPVSLGRLINDILEDKSYSKSDLTVDVNGICHCLDFASKYQSDDCGALIDRLNDEFACLKSNFETASVIAVTFGSSFVYSMTVSPEDAVGNCHKLPSNLFRRLSLDVDATVRMWTALLEKLISTGKKIILTVSPIRHLADGLHGNELSKARLLLICDRLAEFADYFPAYEIMIDDLRDYRFYASDMKHPSEVACDYIYEKFSQTYFTSETIERARYFRDKAAHEAHRQIIN